MKTFSYYVFHLIKGFGYLLQVPTSWIVSSWFSYEGFWRQLVSNETIWWYNWQDTRYNEHRKLGSFFSGMRRKTKLLQTVLEGKVE